MEKELEREEALDPTPVAENKTEESDRKFLKRFANNLATRNYNKEGDAEELETLKEMADRGNAEAAYLYGIYCYTGSAISRKDAVEYWRKAARAGHPKAAASLGDYYYVENAPDYWYISWNYYTRQDALPLTGPRRKAVIDILNHEKYNMRVFLMGVLFLLITLLPALIIQSSTLFAAGILMMILLDLLEIGTFVLAVLQCRRTGSFCSIQWLLPTLFGVWSVVMLIELL